MDERISKIFGPNTLILIQTLIILVSFSNLTEFFYHYAEEHGALAGIVLFGHMQAGYLVAGLMAIGIDSATMVFTIATLKVWEATHVWYMVLFPVILMGITSTYSAIGNYITIRAQTVGYTHVDVLGISANALAPLMISSLPYLSIIITVAIPFVFPRTKAATAEEQQQTLLRIQQEAEIKAMRARAGAQVVAARVGGLTDVAKSTGVGKRFVEKIGLDDGPQAPEETPEDQLGMAVLGVSSEPEWVSTSGLSRIYNRHIGSGKRKVDDDGRTIRNWADNGKIPGEKLDGRTWSFDLNVLAEHPDFKTIIARHRRAEEKKKLGVKAGPSRPVPVDKAEWGESGPLATPDPDFMRRFQNTPSVADR